MINDLSFLQNREQPLDAWLFDTMAIVNDIIYSLNTQLNQSMNEVFEDVC